MTITAISATRKTVGLDRYLSEAPAHDIDSPDGFGRRVEYETTIGGCTPETFIADIRRTREAFGKQSLAIETYHVVLSQSHEEADPYDEGAGLRQHEMARVFTDEAFPGHQAKLTTQRDNGRYEGPEDDPVWMPGKWHTHIQIASVSERDATVIRIGSDGLEETRHYAAGRAINGFKSSIAPLRRTTDRVVLRELHYDNAAYVQACDAAKDRTGREKITRRDYAMRADPDGPGYSNHDAVRMQLRQTRALATDWDDYTARLRANGVNTKLTGKAGVSYSWIALDGTEIKARARGKNGLGNDATKAEVEKQCAINAASRGKGIELTAPPAIFAPPTTTTDRPVPIYLTPDGRAPWDAEFDSYVEHVRQTGGTYEGRALVALRQTIADPWVTDRNRLIAAAPDYGITLEDRGGDVIVAVPARDGSGDVAFSTARLGPAWAGRGLDEYIDITRTKETHAHDTRRDAGGATGQRTAERTGGIDKAALAARRADNLRRAAQIRTEQYRERAERAARDTTGTPATGQPTRDRDADQRGKGADSPPRDAGKKPASPMRDRIVGNTARPGKDRGYSR